MRDAITVLVLVISTATGWSQQAPFLDPTWSAILPASHARDISKQCSRPAPESVDDVWAPSAEDIAALEPALENS